MMIWHLVVGAGLAPTPLRRLWLVRDLNSEKTYSIMELLFVFGAYK